MVAQQSWKAKEVEEMSHKLSELGIQHDGFICFNNPNEVVSDKEFEEIKNELANMRKEALKMLAEKKNGALSKPIFQVTFSGKIVNFWPSAKEAGRHGFDFSKVAMCARGERSQHKGFQWMHCSQCKGKRFLK